VEGTWATLYDVSREGIGLIPWFFAAMWLAGLCAGVVALKLAGIFAVAGPKKAHPTRTFLVLWLLGWTLMGGFGIGNVFYQYAANNHALRAGSCAVVEGPIENFHHQDPWKKGDSERFSVNGHSFSYSSANLGGGGLRSSNSFALPLVNGLYARIWYRDGIICRIDARH
jgi:hypothetical protein